MAQSKEYKQGYEAAIKALQDMLSGKDQQTNGGQSKQSGNSLPQGTDSNGNGANMPQLNQDDQKKADKNAKQNGGGNSQADSKYRKEAADATGSCGGVISQAAGAAIAKSEGYDTSDCKEESTSTISRTWHDAAIESCSQNNCPGKGNIITRFRDYYITSHDWKGELKKYIGRALSSFETDSKWGKKKWLAQDEIKKFDKPAEGDLDSVIFLIDCSGSVSDKLLQNIISECWTICKKKGVKKVTYCYYDDGITQIETNDTMHTDGVIAPEMVRKIKSNLKPEAEVHGRGGNQEDIVMNQLTQMLKKSRKHPELVMWFTDGYTYARPTRPKLLIKNMIWVIYDNNNFEVKDDSKVIHIKSADLGK